MTLPLLTVNLLCQEAQAFARVESLYAEPTLFGVTDGKAIGTYVEHKFKAHLAQNYTYASGSSALGIDFPQLAVDLKVTSIRQPQSSCPYKAARQKIFGLGYSLLIFVYNKMDDPSARSATLAIAHTLFIQQDRTADYQTTLGLRQILDNGGNADDLVAFMTDRYLPLDEIEAHNIAQELLSGMAMPQGYLTISNALQWRLQYSRVIEQAGRIDGIVRLGPV